MNKLHEDLLKELESIYEQHDEELIEELVGKGDGDHKHEMDSGWLEYQVKDGAIIFVEYFYNVESEFVLEKYDYEEGGE